MRGSLRIAATVAAVVAATLVLTFVFLDGRRNPGSGAEVVRSPQSEDAPLPGHASGPRQQLNPFTTVVQDFEYGEPDFAATRDKAQSKLWFHDGSWWATMIDPFSTQVRIFELRNGSWVDTGVFVDARVQSSADVVWTGKVLYIASRTSTGELLLQRYTYGAGRRWIPKSTNAQLIARGGGESLTIAVDSQDRVWATWVTAGRMLLASSGPGGTGWRAPMTLAGGGDVTDDDATAITELNGQIGVMWSNQQRDAFFWAVRSDRDPVDRWSEPETIAQGVNIADGHVNLAVSPTTGDLFAVVKTSLRDDGEPLESPLLEVLRRTPNGTWSRTTAATVGSQMTRAQLVITTDGRYLILVAASPQTGGSLYYKVTEAANPRFAPGKGSLLLGWEGAEINNATMTRAPVDPAVPLVVLASDSRAGRYYHAELLLADVLRQP